MHTIRHNTHDSAETWEVIFVFSDCDTVVVGVYSKIEDAFGICSYLNGGLPPAGYTMGIINHA
jgi:hypothetical protein